jgi:hypothetical protein
MLMPALVSQRADEFIVILPGPQTIATAAEIEEKRFRNLT